MFDNAKNKEAETFHFNWNISCMDKLFKDLNEVASDNFAITWLYDYDSSFKNQLVHAGHHETFELVSHLQPDMINAISGFSDENKFDSSEASYLKILVKENGPEKAKRILREMLESIG